MQFKVKYSTKFQKVHARLYSSALDVALDRGGVALSLPQIFFMSLKFPRGAYNSQFGSLCVDSFMGT